MAEAISTHSSYDATVMAVLDQVEFEGVNHHYAVVLRTQDGEETNISLRQLRAARDVAFLGKDWEGHTFPIFENETEGLSSKIRKILLEGRVHLVLLINAHGGRVSFRTRMGEIIQNIDRLDGRTTAFASFSAMSAAADIFGDCSDRRCLADTEFMWHAAYSDRYSIAEQHADIRKEIDDYSKFLIGASKTHLRKRMKRVLRGKQKQSDSFQCEVEFSGKELDKFGICKTRASADALRRLFERETGITISEHAKSNVCAWNVRRFFEVASAVEKIRARFHLLGFNAHSSTDDPLKYKFVCSDTSRSIDRHTIRIIKEFFLQTVTDVTVDMRL